MQMNFLCRWLAGPFHLVAFCFWILSCAAANAGPVGIGWTPHGTLTTAGYIAPDGHLNLFDGGVAGWTCKRRREHRCFPE